jgi:hypothetical protein
MKDQINNENIKKLIYKKYLSSIELENLKNKFKEFFNANKYFREYCKNNNISYHFLNRTSFIKSSSFNYKK